MASTQMHNLTTLIKRLEAATLRLEDMAETALGAPADTNGAAATASQRSTSIAPSPIVPAATLAPPPLPLPAVVESFDEFLEEDVKKFVELSNKIGDTVSIQASNAKKAFAACRKIILVTTKAKKPEVSSQAYMETLKDLQETLSAVDGIKEANRGSSLSNHLAAIAEGLPMLGWVAVEAKPQTYVKEMMDAAQFYGNRVSKEYKEKDPTHIQWIQSYYGIGQGLIEYINKHYPHGMTWNNKDGIDAAEALRQVEAGNIGTAAPSGAPAPPPPPPPPPPPAPAPAVGAASSAPDMGAVFDQLSRGSDVTANLKKVDPSQMTHKNPSLRASSSVPARSDSLKSASSVATAGRGKSPIPSRKPESLRTKKPPKKVLESNKWYIENYDNPGEIIEIQATLQQSVLITKCAKTTVRVYGKANAISIDSSSNVSLIVESLVSSVDVIKTAKFEMQVLGKLPTILLDQVDTSNIYLGPESLDTEILTSKCTAVNINVPGATEEDDYKECAVPEQIKTVIKNGVAVSEIVEHAG